MRLFNVFMWYLIGNSALPDLLKKVFN